MPRIIMLIPIDVGVGLTSVSLGVSRAIEQKSIRLSVFKPITQTHTVENASGETATLIHKNYSPILASAPLHMNYVKKLLGTNQQDVLLEKIVALYHDSIKNAEVVLIQGLAPTLQCQFSNTLNYAIAKTLNAEMVFVISPGNDSPIQLKERIERACSSFGGNKNKNIAGVIINKLNAPVDKGSCSRLDLSEIFYNSTKGSNIYINPMQIFADSPLPVLGCVPWSCDLVMTRAIDIARYLNARIINAGDMMTRRIKSVTFCTCSLPHMLENFHPGSLLVTSSDRPDVFVMACLAAVNGIKIGAILLTSGYPINERIQKLCKCAFEAGLPVFIVDTNTWQTSLNLQNFNLKMLPDDYGRIEKAQSYIASYIDSTWIKSLSVASSKHLFRLSPPEFRYKITKLAQKASRCIVLPEGYEPRTIKAASICAKRGIAKCVLLGNQNEIRRVATAQGIELKKGIDIIDPVNVRKNYIARLVELRQNKGMNEALAQEQMLDNVMLGTMMLEKGEVDGLVSGAIHTTANTIRPPLQLIKTAPGSSLVSSVFFMLLPDQVLVYGDCAINPDPSAEQLSEIAIQSADSAAFFGIEPRIAMISYSTGTSGVGRDVEKVREATLLVQKKRPDLIIDGPLQYDAAIVADIAKSKAPNSPVAGQATVFIFPNLNTGNTTYKAVQRSADLISIGPMLQGLRKPVNDLSRGALVDDIVYTIALTAIQSVQSDVVVKRVNSYKLIH